MDAISLDRLDRFTRAKFVLRLLSPFRLAYGSHFLYRTVISISFSNHDELRLFTVGNPGKSLVYHSSFARTWSV